MGLITRSEATHRLKLMANKVNQAASAARDGLWDEAATAVVEANELLEAILPHLTEASMESAVPEAWQKKVYGTGAATSGTKGGLGYRGSSHSHPSPDQPPPPDEDDTVNVTPPAPIKVKKRVILTPPPAIPIVTPPPAPVKPRVIIPPAPPRPAAPPPPPPPEVRVFDLGAISGQLDWYARSKSNPAVDPTDWDMTEAFERLSKETKDKIAAAYRANGGKPVSIDSL
jgi:hypothetical protein